VEDKAMKIEGTASGELAIDGKTYDHDVVIRLSGEIVKRKKKLSKQLYRTSHVLTKPTAEAIGVFNRTRGKTIGLFHITC
jgi:hypothetical protein